LRDFTYVDDAVDALLLAAANDAGDGHAFNLGGECAISLKDLASLLVDANGGGEYKVRSFPEDRKRIDIGDYYADDRLIRNVLGWEPKVPLREGLASTLAYYRADLKHYL
jgi:UDP-glucose 4-epimerase